MVLNKVPHVEFIKNIQENGRYQLEDRRGLKIITIDPPNSSDFDDGFGIVEYNETGIQIGWRISIYIANVFLWLEALDLWKTFSHRVSTIYLPDRKRPMLPTVLSDTLCSLQENQDRFALAMDVYVDMEGNFIENKEIEIAYFGLLEEFQNKKLGSYLLSEAIKISFSRNVNRVWLHTCSLDHRNALNNYISRGMQIFKTETVVI